MEQQYLAQWMKNRTGPLASQGSNHLEWVRIPDDAPLWSKYPDPSTGKNTPHVELVINVSCSLEIHFLLLTPDSRVTGPSQNRGLQF